MFCNVEKMRKDLLSKNPESESYLFFGQVEMSRGGRNGFGGRGGGRGRSRFVFIICFCVKILNACLGVLSCLGVW